jgi:hypothetical protein
VSNRKKWTDQSGNPNPAVSSRRSFQIRQGCVRPEQTLKSGWTISLHGDRPKALVRHASFSEMMDSDTSQQRNEASKDNPITIHGIREKERNERCH